MDRVKVIIDGMEVFVPRNYTVLQAAKEVGIEIPTLCYLKGINEIGSCRICLVEVEGARNLQAACVSPVFDGMVVKTKTEAVRLARKTNLELILSHHDKRCLTCIRNGNCELQKLAEEFNISEWPYEGESILQDVDDKSPAIVRDQNKCVLCGRCVSVCGNIQTVYAIGVNERGFETRVSPAFGRSLDDSPCITCGQCIISCPVGALGEKEHIEKVWEALSNPDVHVVAQTAPSIRVSLGEEFGMPLGQRVTGKMVAALKMLGFDKVFDTDLGADLTIMEESAELLHRLQSGGKLPLMTSCCPGWVSFCEKFYPELIDNLSTCKSPHMMLGSVIKSYYSEKVGIPKEKIFVVSIMPCTAKKYEIERPEMQKDGIKDVDAVLTTREIAKMIKEAGIDFKNLKDEPFDNPLGEATGAGVIFGTTGGVMEAALRTVADLLEGKEIRTIDYTDVRGMEGVREAQIQIGGQSIKIAVAHSLGHARLLMDKIINGEAEYHFIEVMACPGGCINGGGQPILSSRKLYYVDPKVYRSRSIYDEDKCLTIRKSHENPQIKVLYKECFEKPLSKKSHELLHTHYYKKELYPRR